MFVMHFIRFFFLPSVRYLVESLFACASDLLRGFRAGDYLPFMDGMAERHGKAIKREFDIFLNHENP